MKQLKSPLHAFLIALIVIGFSASSAFGSATIIIQNLDGAGVGFNDPTAATPVGGNTGTTIGQQRLNAFTQAANIWGQTLTSGPTIVIRASWSNTMACTATSGTLGSAGTVSSYANFAGAPFTETWYGVALANTLANADLNTTNTAEISAQFNSRLGTTGCLENTSWYYGLDTANAGNQINLVTVLLHEFAHGLGFSAQPTNTETGVQVNGRPSVYERFLLDITTGKTWNQMTDAERVSSAINTGNLVWSGAQATADSAILVNGRDPQGHPLMYSPNPRVAGSSVSHWSNVLSPNQLMEPNNSFGLSHSVTLPQDLTFSLLRDIGWCSGCPQPPPPSPTPTPTPPANDNFASAQVLSGCSGNVTGSNVLATKETGEPAHLPASPGSTHSIWYQWQAPSTGTVTLTTENSDFDTVLAVYTGSSVGSLSQLANDDDSGPGTTSSITFPATAGVTYRFAVDGYDNNSGGDTGTVRINWSQSNCSSSKLDQTISFSPLPDRTWGDAPFTLNATASSGLPVSFSIVSGPATIAVNTVTLTGTGVVTVRATQAGDANYNAATPIDRSFTVTKADQFITFNALANKVFGDAPFTVSATASSALPVSFSIVSGPATIAVNTVTLTGTGVVTVRATQAGDANYNAATSIDRSFTVTKADQFITFNALANKVFGDPPFTVSATASSGLPVSFSIVSGPATIAVNTVTPTGTGVVTVRTTQAGDANYNAATPIDRSFTVTKADQFITFNALANKVFGDAPFTVSATASSALPVSFSIVSGPATIAVNTVTLTGTGVVTVRATQAGDANYNAATPIDRSFTVTKADQFITFGTLASKVFGDPAFNLTAVASSSLPVSFSIISGPAIVSGNTVTISGAGQVTVRASQTGDGNYNVAPSVDRVFTVAKSNQTILFNALPSKTFGDAPFGLIATASSGLPIGFEILSGPATVSGNTLTITGTGIVTVKASQPGDANYNIATETRSFTVVSANANISLSSLAHIYNGSTKAAAVTTNPAGLNFTISYTLNGQPVTSPINAGEYAVVASINDPNFQGSTTGTLVINKALPIVTWPNPPNITFGTPLSSTQFNATANVPGNFQYAPAPGTVLSVGTYQLNTIFVPSDVANFFSTSASVQLTVVPAPSVQFSASSLTIAEGAGSVQITVNRVDPSAAAIVEYATSDTAALNACNVINGIASERCDYATTVGTLRFAAGEATKNITVPVVNDVHVEGNESFTIALSSPVGTTLGSPNSVVITITDDDTTPSSQNPIDGVDPFVTQQYIDFLGRLPDAGGFANWKATLGGCPNGGFGEFDNPTCDRVHVSAGFFLSDEFRGRGYWAYRFYEVGFDRRPTYNEFVPDMSKVGGAQSPESEVLSKAQYTTDFGQRPEFISRYNGMTNDQYVNALEQQAEITLANKQAIINSLSSGTSRVQVLRDIVESQAVENRFFIRAFVAMQYFGYLRRDPDTVGYNNWVSTLTANPADFRHMIFGFIYSGEYRSRFGSQ